MLITNLAVQNCIHHLLRLGVVSELENNCPSDVSVPGVSRERHF